MVARARKSQGNEGNETREARAKREKKEPVVNFAELVAKQETATELPRMKREAQENPFTQKVRESFENDEVYELPAIPEEALTSVRVAIRRGARLAGLGVSIREIPSDEGIVLRYKGKTRNKRNSEGAEVSETDEVDETDES